jgi:hypothetical protein
VASRKANASNIGRPEIAAIADWLIDGARSAGRRGFDRLQSAIGQNFFFNRLGHDLGTQIPKIVRGNAGATNLLGTAENRDELSETRYMPKSEVGKRP